MINTSRQKIPVREVKGDLQRLDFTNGGGDPLIILTPLSEVLVFGVREESFGHEIVRFVPTNQIGSALTVELENDLFRAYTDQYLIFYEDGRFVSFVSPIGGVGTYNPREQKYGIMYPVIILDLVKCQFTFVSMNNRYNFNESVKVEQIKEDSFVWYAGLKPEKVISKFRELNPKIDLSKPKPSGFFMLLKNLSRKIWKD